MWQGQTPLLEIAARVTLIYLALLLLVRLGGKREVGQLGPLELLAMLILSETVSPALTAQDTSLTAALAAATTLLLLTGVVGRLTYHSPTLQRWIDGEPVVLVEDARLVEEAARSERIAEPELQAALRSHGLESLAHVRQAVVEPSGEISVVPRR